MDTKPGEAGRVGLVLAASAVALVPIMVVWGTLGLKRIEANDVTTTVYITICNDGIVSTGEVCDMGAGNNTGTYSSSTADRICAPGCEAWGPYCGDGILQVRFGEQCDNGGANSPTGICDTNCRPIPPAPPPGSPSRGSTPSLPAVPGIIQADKETRVVVKGKAFPLSNVAVLVDGKKVGTVRSDSNADFLFSTNQVAPGTETFGFVGTDKNGATSITSSVVFEVVQSAITTVANVFLPPSIAVSATRIPPGEPLTISGYTVPLATTTVLIQPGDTRPIVAVADKSGAWAIQVDTASLKNGFHTAKAAFQLTSIVKSGYGKALNFYVGTDLPKNAPSPDLNHDGKVNLVDFSIFLLSWNTDTWDTDFNQDGITNLADFSIMLFAWTG
jgi:hypothetical protein